MAADQFLVHTETVACLYLCVIDNNDPLEYFYCNAHCLVSFAMWQRPTEILDLYTLRQLDTVIHSDTVQKLITILPLPVLLCAPYCILLA